MKRILLAVVFSLFSVFGVMPDGVAQNDDAGNEPNAFEATLLPSGDVEVQGSIETVGDVDCFMFQASTGTTYTIETSELGSDLDTLIVLFDRNSETVLKVDDDGGQDRGSLIEFTPTSSGLHFVCVRNARSTQGTGTYTLTITTASTASTTPPTTTPPTTTTTPTPTPTPAPTTTTQPTDPPGTTEPPTTDDDTRNPVVTTGTIQRNGLVALLGGDDDDSIRNVQNYLVATGAFPGIEAINVSNSTPSAAELNQYEAVMVWADSGFQDAERLGDLLADYVDRGGGVVVAAVSFDIPDPFDPDTLGGRFFSGGYYVIEPTADNISGDRRTLGSVNNPSHPIMQGISKIDGGPSSLHSPTSGLTSGSTMLAAWDNGDVLVASKSLGQNRRADINLFPPSSLLDPDLWPFTPDNQVPQLMVNALLWASGRDQPFNPAPTEGPGQLEVLTAALSIAARPDENPVGQSITLRNSGGQTISWSASVDVAWLSLNPMQGDLEPGSSQNVAVSIDVSSLNVGVHNGTITISAPGADVAVVRVPVTLNLSSGNTPTTTPPTTTTPTTPSTPVVVPTVPNSGNILRVPSEFFLLQDAINAAGSGDIIEISAGIYNGDLIIDKSLTLRGVGGGNTVIRGNPQSPVITITTSTPGVALEGLAISRGTDGVRVDNAAVAVISDVMISDNFGWGVRLVGAANVAIVNTTISGNGSGGISIDVAGANNQNSQVIMSQNTIQSNSGCGVFVASDESGIRITGNNNRVTGNSFDLCDNGGKLPNDFSLPQDTGNSDSGNTGTNFDGDGDGVPDADDFCPVTPGDPAKNGCP
jgi:hypothetical protein